MTTIIALAGLVILSWVTYGLIRRMTYLAAHGEAHCDQIGELQRVLAQLAQHLDNATIDALPPDVLDYVRQFDE